MASEKRGHDALADNMDDGTSITDSNRGEPRRRFQRANGQILQHQRIMMSLADDVGDGAKSPSPEAMQTNPAPQQVTMETLETAAIRSPPEPQRVRTGMSPIAGRKSWIESMIESHQGED